MRPKSKLFPVIVLVMQTLAMSTFATEELIWKMGEPDRSDHEFNSGMNIRGNEGVFLRMGSENEAAHWPNFQPGSGNGAFDGHPYHYTLSFDLPESAIQGVFYLDLSLLFRQPRTPALELEIHGHRGLYYFDPEPMFDIGAVSDEFNSTRSVARRKIALPASFFHAGENSITFTAVDIPPVVITNRNVGGDGDSGFYYDSLALTHDADATFDDQLGADLKPTVFFRKTAQGVKEECQLTIHYSSAWQGGHASLTLGKFATQIEVPRLSEFGEGRYTILVPEDASPGTAQIDLSDNSSLGEQTFAVNFVPAKKWKLFYTPNEHMDVGYTDYRAKVAELHARNVDKLIEVLNTHPDYRFNLDGSWIMDQWLGSRSPSYAEELAPHIRAGQLGMNAFYSCPATEYPSLEENIRNLYYSKELQTELGIPFDFALISDVPSVSWSVPSILASAGIRYFANGGNQDRGPLLVSGHWNVRSPFWWEGPDGQRVLTWFAAHYHQFKALCGLPPTIESGRGGISRFLRAYELADYKPDAVLIYGTEVENLPTEYDDASFVGKWNTEFAYPQIITCRFPQFFQYIEKNYGDELPVVRGTGGAYWADNFGILAGATARDRANQTRAISAETLASITTTLNPQLSFARDLDHDIWRDTLLYAEHNFGTGRTGAQPERDEVVGVVNEKENFTVLAEWDIDKLMRRSMSQLADQIQTEGQNLIVFNSLSWQRSGFVSYQLDDGTTLIDMATGRSVNFEIVAEKDGVQTIRFWAKDIPPLGYKVYRLGTGSIRKVNENLQSPDNVVENQFYKITFDPSHAAMKSIYDKQLGRELVDSTSPYLANEYLFVSGGGTEKGRGTGAEDSQLLHPFRWLPPAQLTVHPAEQGVLVEVDKTPWGQRIRMTASAVHTPQIETEILLPDKVKEIDVNNRIQVDLLYAKQASYFAFPWNMSSPVFNYDIPNDFANPATDLLEGGCSDWFSVQHLVNVEDEGLSVNLATVDAPLVCLGDINRGRWSPQFTNNTPTVFSYALNNYWSPKWAGKKSAELTYRYVITSDRHFDLVQAARLGREARTPLEVSELKMSDKSPGLHGKLPPGEASFGSVTPDNIVMTALKSAEDGKGLVVRMLETGGHDSDGVLELPFMWIGSAKEANAVEVPGAPLRHDAHHIYFRIHPHQVLTIRLMPREDIRWSTLDGVPKG